MLAAVSVLSFGFLLSTIVAAAAIPFATSDTFWHAVGFTQLYWEQFAEDGSFYYRSNSSTILDLPLLFQAVVPFSTFLIFFLISTLIRASKPISQKPVLLMLNRLEGAKSGVITAMAAALSSLITIATAFQHWEKGG